MCDNMDGPRGYYAKSSKSKRRNKTETQRYREQIDSCQMGEGLGRWVAKVK